jgi:hypothetical protein
LCAESYLDGFIGTQQGGSFFSKACFARASLREVRTKVHGPEGLTVSCHRPTAGGTQTLITGFNGEARQLY